jgi:hypothetical protein
MNPSMKQTQQQHKQLNMLRGLRSTNLKTSDETVVEGHSVLQKGLECLCCLLGVKAVGL